ncbi:MAG: hypothetical protein KAH84_07745 [Thiomargarita sp.]|nr:hypothetical protein [Thiomargarita sp.]
MPSITQFLPLNIVFTLPIIIQLLYFLASFIIGIFGRKKKMGFWGLFFFSAIFSPIMGIVVLAAS